MLRFLGITKFEEQALHLEHKSTVEISLDCAKFVLFQTAVNNPLSLWKCHKFSNTELSANCLASDYLSFFMKRLLTLTDFSPITSNQMFNFRDNFLWSFSMGWLVLCNLCGLPLCISPLNPRHHSRPSSNLNLPWPLQLIYTEFSKPSWKCIVNYLFGP
jgi:hypothetical protein